MLNLYVTGSSKKSGKTFITAGLAATMQSLDYSTAVYKPIQTGGVELNGFMQSPDLKFIKTINPYVDVYFTYMYKTDAEPVFAAEWEKEVINPKDIINDFNNIKKSYEYTIIDGCGGVLSPIAPNFNTLNLISKLEIPMLVVMDANENSIHNTLMTIECAKNAGVKIRGVVINNVPEYSADPYITSIPRIVEEYSGVKILGVVKNTNPSPNEIIAQILNGIEIESVFDVKIEKLDIE